MLVTGIGLLDGESDGENVGEIVGEYVGATVGEVGVAVPIEFRGSKIHGATAVLQLISDAKIGPPQQLLPPPGNLLHPAPPHRPIQVIVNVVKLRCHDLDVECN